jgi:hypothetical protein
VLVVVLAAGAPVAFAAADDSDDTGRLNLNTTVLVNESVGAGSSGEFAVRGDLFSDRLSRRAVEKRERSAERLRVVETLEFTAPEPAGEEYQSVRAALFENYSSDVIASAPNERAESSALLGVLAAVTVPLVLLAGLVLGRFWAGRRRVSS